MYVFISFHSKLIQPLDIAIFETVYGNLTICYFTLHDSLLENLVKLIAVCRLDHYENHIKVHEWNLEYTNTFMNKTFY